MKSKKIIQIFVVILLSICWKSNYSQIKKAKDIFTSDEVVWYGLDFSNAKFIGKFNHDLSQIPVSEFELVTKYIPAWNALVIMEPNNFDLKNAFRKKSIYNDLNPVKTRNDRINVEGIKTLNSHLIAKSEIPKMISEYKDGDKHEGLGLTFIVESFDKSNELGSFWVVFFDIKTKLVLFSEHCSGEPLGFGLRNYWAGSLKHVLKDIQYIKYEIWKKRFLKESNEVTNK